MRPIKSIIKKISLNRSIKPSRASKILNHDNFINLLTKYSRQFAYDFAKRKFRLGAELPLLQHLLLQE